MSAPMNAPISGPAPVAVRHLAVPPMDSEMRTRFAPAPSGDLHVGNVRTALFSWALARRHAGTFLLRVEDTDRSRVSDEAYAAALDVLRWIGINWDEGPQVGGPYAPYRQSERLPFYAEAAARLRETGAAYSCYCTPAELAERREQARAANRPPGYDGRCRTLTAQERAAFEAQGRTSVLRFWMPDGTTTWNDLVRGEITIDHANVPDFAITRSDGHPLYLLAAGVDDVAMGLTHIVRGEDLVTATPRQLALYAALGHPQERWPAFAHLPLIVGADNAPLSKRHGEVSVAWYRRSGFMPEALANYLALLGWSPGGDREFFGPEVLLAEFDLHRVSRNPARFDLKKLEALNGDWIRSLPVEELTARVAPVLAAAGLESVGTPELMAAVPLIRERMNRLTEAAGLLHFLFVDESLFAVEEAAAAKGLGEGSGAVLRAASERLIALGEWAAEAIESQVWGIGEQLGLSRKRTATPLRVAITGQMISPPLFESMELLGRERTLSRIQRAAGSGG
jgi:glutamyl-tRNA synthetase